jgi:hypothetical protein
LPDQQFFKRRFEFPEYAFPRKNAIGQNGSFLPGFKRRRVYAGAMFHKYGRIIIEETSNGVVNVWRNQEQRDLCLAG